jgi:hypothetical protein
VWRLLYPRAVRLGSLKKKGKQEKRAEPKTRIGSVSCPVASAPDPNVRLRFEKPPLDLSAIRQCGRLLVDAVNALAARSPHSLGALSSKRNPTNPTDRA